MYSSLRIIEYRGQIKRKCYDGFPYTINGQLVTAFEFELYIVRIVRPENKRNPVQSTRYLNRLLIHLGSRVTSCFDFKLHLLVSALRQSHGCKNLIETFSVIE